MLTERATHVVRVALVSFALHVMQRPAAAQVALGRCGEPATFISTIQGTDARSPSVGRTVVIEAALIADVRRGLDGVFVEEERGDQDGDPASSEGLFLAVPGADLLLPPGSTLRALGDVAELNGLTALSPIRETVVCPGDAVAVEATPLNLPFAIGEGWKRVEGMLIRIPQRLTVTGNFELGRYGSLDLSVVGRLIVPTQLVTPGAAALALQAENDRARVVLDDASAVQNPVPTPYLDREGTRRLGSTLESLTGVVDARFGAYRLHPTLLPEFANRSTRPAAPDPVGGSLRVAFMNVFNYFTTLDRGVSQCGPGRNMACRGANTETELQRQRAKLISALATLDADVVGLSEIENAADVAVDDLVAALNDVSPSSAYASVSTGTLGSDAIKLALLYKSSRVEPYAAPTVLTHVIDPLFADDLQRPALAQTFVEHETAEPFTVVLAHLKSKGSACPDDPDRGDGQGNCNQMRTAAAQALSRWILGDPTRSATSRVLLLGDFNAYANEDPIAALRAAGLTSLTEMFVGTRGYSYQYAGQSGYLDHAFATPDIAALVTGVTHWHIDADEPAVLDFNLEFKADDHFDPCQPFRASDHDPLLLGLQLGQRSRSVFPLVDLRAFVASVGRALRLGFARALSEP